MKEDFSIADNIAEVDVTEDLIGEAFSEIVSSSEIASQTVVGFIF